MNYTMTQWMGIYSEMEPLMLAACEWRTMMQLLSSVMYINATILTVSSSDDDTVNATALARTQLTDLLTLTKFKPNTLNIDRFITVVLARGGHMSSFKLIIERALLRAAENERQYAADTPKVWHSDRTKSPSASYDFTLSTSFLDLLVWTDTLCFHPMGYMSLTNVSEYHDDQLLLITRRVNAGDKTKIENTLRAAINVTVWLSATHVFEIWRWSWTHADALTLLSPYTRAVASFWSVTVGVNDNITLATLITVITTLIYTLVEVIRLYVTKPWRRQSLIQSGNIDNEEAYHRKYEQRERDIVLFRALPLYIVMTASTTMLLSTFSLTINYSFFSPSAVIIYVVVFHWLTSVIMDVYIIKFIVYAATLCFHHRLSHALRAPMCPCTITPAHSTMILNPLRPASTFQLRSVIRKNIDLLWSVNNEHVISILILQCVGNNRQQYYRYERVLREELYDRANIPQHIKDRFFVFQMGGISKPHNMYKVMHWLFMSSEGRDCVTQNYLFGIDTELPIARLPQLIRRTPFPLTLDTGHIYREVLPWFMHAVDVNGVSEHAVSSPHRTVRTLKVDTPPLAHKSNSNTSGKSGDTAAADDASSSSSISSTYEPLVYLGGWDEYNDSTEQGSEAGILCTVAGLRTLAYLRNESHPSQPLIENFVVLDADNYVKGDTLLAMMNTMNDDYLVWQPSIKFYNNTQSMYAYMKNYSNTHLGNMVNSSTTVLLGGVRSFGKYFGRLKPFYYEECTAESFHSAPSTYPAVWGTTAFFATLLTLGLCIQPLYWNVTIYLFIATPLFFIFGIALTLYTQHNPNRVSRLSSRYQNMFPLSRLFIQSEDARHGGPFGRAAFVMDATIFEATPSSPIDDSKREMTKWMPTFDMRDFFLLHTPIIVTHAHTQTHSKKHTHAHTHT